jgi:leader peptidase (prepilin peptidase)/N-methyltransferase
MMLMIFPLIGFASGVMVNYLADVLPATRRLSKPLWWPITGTSMIRYFSSIRVALVLVLFVAAGWFLANFPPDGFSAELLLLLLLYFGLVTVIDIEYRVVMHPVSIAGVVLMAVIGVWRHGLASTLIGGAAGFGLMLGLFYLGDWLSRLARKLPVEKSQETALGFGDVNLAGVIGLLMGWPGVLGALVLGIFVGGLFSLFYIGFTALTGRYRLFAAIPYAPFLCIGTMATIFLSLY